VLTPQENELLCRVGPQAPMGRMLRRYWTPVAMSDELEPGTQKPIRALCENFSAVRGEDGAVSAAFPVHEEAGLVWAYFGPEPAPPVPAFAFTLVPQGQRINTKHRADCNWVQSLEGAIDSSHSNYLHSADIRQRPSRDGQPHLVAENTSYGFCYAALRRPIVDPQRHHYVRVTHFVAPYTAVIPLGTVQNVQIFVPIDDEHNYMYNIKFDPARPLGELAQQPSLGPSDGDFGTDRNRANGWLQDRAAMRAGTSFTGITGIRNQDRAVQESMGPLYDRSKEHLGTSDVAIIRMRRLMLDSVGAFAERGAQPLGVGARIDGIYGVEGMLALDQPWQRLLDSGTPA
jgi:phthalate 4,5-dioxygenase